MQRIERLAVFRRQLEPVLITVDGLVLRAVILEYSFYILHPRDEYYIYNEQRDTEDAFYQIQDDLVRREMLAEIYHPCWTDHEYQYGEQQREHN